MRKFEISEFSTKLNVLHYNLDTIIAVGYNQQQSINDLIKRAIVVRKESGYNIDDHFALQRKMVDIGFNTKRKVEDYKLSRYA